MTSPTMTYHPKCPQCDNLAAVNDDFGDGGPYDDRKFWTLCDPCFEADQEWEPKADFIKIDLKKNKDTYPTMNKTLTICQMTHLDLWDEIPYKWIEDYIDDEERDMEVEITKVEPDVDYRTKYQFVFELQHHTRDGNHILKKQFTSTVQFAWGSTYGMVMGEVLRRECSECCNELDDEEEDESICMECQEKEYYSKYDSIALFQKREAENQDWGEDVRELGPEVQIEGEYLPEDRTDLPFKWELSFKEQKMIMNEVEVSECMTLRFFQRVTRDDNRKRNTCCVYVQIHPIDRVMRCEYSGSSGTARWLSELDIEFEYDDN